VLVGAQEIYNHKVIIICIYIFINAYVYMYAEAVKPLDTAAMKALYIYKYIHILYIVFYIIYND
jgi:hypothetical protein